MYRKIYIQLCQNTLQEFKCSLNILFCGNNIKLYGRQIRFIQAKNIFFLGLSLVGFVFSSFTFSSLNKSPDSDRLVCSSSTVTAQFATNLLKHDPI